MRTAIGMTIIRPGEAPFLADKEISTIVGDLMVEKEESIICIAYCIIFFSVSALTLECIEESCFRSQYQGFLG